LTLLLNLVIAGVLKAAALPRATSFFPMRELTAQKASSDCWLSLRCVEPAAFAYFSDLNRP
jgi:hypothetical protein